MSSPLLHDLQKVLSDYPETQPAEKREGEHDFDCSPQGFVFVAAKIVHLVSPLCAPCAGRLPSA